MSWDARATAVTAAAPSARDALAVRRRVAGLLQHLRPAGQRQHRAGRRHGPVPGRRRRRRRRRRSRFAARAAPHDLRRRRAAGGRIRSFGIDITATRRSSPSARCTLPGTTAPVRRRPRVGRRERDEHAVVPGRGRDGRLLRVLRAHEQSERDAPRTCTLTYLLTSGRTIHARRDGAGQQPPDDQRRDRGRRGSPTPTSPRVHVRHRDCGRARDVLAEHQARAGARRTTASA